MRKKKSTSNPLTPYDIAVSMNVGQTEKFQKPIYRLQFFCRNRSDTFKKIYISIGVTVGASI